MRSLTVLTSLLLCNLTLAGPALPPSSPKRFKTFPASSGFICDMDTGPDGTSIWFLDISSPTIGVFDSKTGLVQNYPIHPIPSSGNSNITGFQNCVVRTGNDGKVYVGSSTFQGLIQVNPATTPPKMKTFGEVSPNNGWAGDRGIFLSALNENLIYLFTYEDHNLESFPANSPTGMRTDAYGDLWVLSYLKQDIMKYEGASELLITFPNCCPLPGSVSLTALRAETQHQKYLWAIGTNDLSIRIQPGKSKFETFTNPEESGPLTTVYSSANDYCGRIWYTDLYNNRFGYDNPNKTDDYTTIIVTPDGAFTSAIQLGPGPYMWIASLVSNGSNSTNLLRYTLGACD